ncbi:MAG: BlaI/MecI/CopY family transcriptional regulator [Candidatus Magasanikbacteria bacterium]|nr:BlaI/MecI/CopY family transcriptional regulator [Candidatus Magasanikbacteria bacterium]
MTFLKQPFFGGLEAAVMETIWDLREAAVRDVLKKIGKKKKLAYTTVMTVMSRLFAKGFLKRKLDQKGAYLYTPCQNKESFLASASKKVVNDLLKEYGDMAVAQFIDAVESGNLKKTAQWKEKLKKIK